MILVNNSLARDILRHSDSPVAKGIVFPSFILLSVHLTHRNERELLTQLGHLVSQVQALRMDEQKPIILAGDFNTGFGTVIPGICGEYCGHTSNGYEEVLRFIIDHDLVVINSFFPRAPSRSSFSGNSQTDLDWICASSNLPAKTIRCFYHDISSFTTTDHSAIAICFEFSQPRGFSRSSSHSQQQPIRFQNLGCPAPRAC